MGTIQALANVPINGIVKNALINILIQRWLKMIKINKTKGIIILTGNELEKQFCAIAGIRFLIEDMGISGYAQLQQVVDSVETVFGSKDYRELLRLIFPNHARVLDIEESTRW